MQPHFTPNSHTSANQLPDRPSQHGNSADPTFPVIRGLQAHREYFVAMWSLRMLRQISIFDEDELPLNCAQRTLNKGAYP